MVSVTLKYTVCSQHVSDYYLMIVHVTDVRTWGLYSMLVACFGLVHDDCTCYKCWYMCMVHQMRNLHVTGVSTLCWY